MKRFVCIQIFSFLFNFSIIDVNLSRINFYNSFLYFFLFITTKNIGHFNYEFKNTDDDFIPLMEDIISKYDTIIFATPVYWYSMSGILKVFFDRLSDLLHYKKELGRQLRGKKMAMISNSGENDLRNGFTMPFIESAKYLGMEYLGDIHVWFTKDGKEIHADALKRLDDFKNIL